MKILIYGAGPIGQWLALRLHTCGQNVTLLARNKTFRSLRRNGIEIVDAFTGERQRAQVRLVDGLDPDDANDLVIVAMPKTARLEVCPVLARNPHLKNILFLGNDVAGYHRYLDHLARERVLLGFPGAGGGWDGDDLVVMDREKREGSHGEVYVGELDGVTRPRTLEIKECLEAADIKVHIERDMDGWLKYHFAFIAPTAGVIFAKGGDLRAVAEDKKAIHRYCRACREAGDVLQAAGYRRRQPRIFNLYYWLPRWAEPMVFGKLFGSRGADIRFGLHVRVVGPELLALVDEFNVLKNLTGKGTPQLDALLEHVMMPRSAVSKEEVA